jgi:cyclohexanone monooxygenase
MFLLLGPNGVISYTGVVVNIETQARYIVRAIRVARRSRARSLVVRPEAEQRFLEDVRKRFSRTVWAIGGCRSWYQNSSPSGTLLWPDSTYRYRWQLRSLRRRDFTFAGSADLDR